MADNTIDPKLYGLTERDYSTIINIFRKYPEVLQVNLFGSRAKGNYKKGSDIDFAIINEIPKERVVNKLKIDFEESSLPYRVDIVYFPSLDCMELKEHILRVGIIFYKVDKVV